MNPTNLVRIWKDPDAEGRADHPAGEIDLAVGGFAQILATEYLSTLGCCNGFTRDTCVGCNGEEEIQ